MCELGGEMENLRVLFRSKVGRGNMAGDTYYLRLYTVADIAVYELQNNCPECGLKKSVQGVTPDRKRVVGQ